MPTITSIKQQKNKNRVNVYLDDKFGFGIDLDNFVLLHLRVDQELSEKEIEEIIKKAEFQKTLDKVLRFATVRPRSEKEILDWFRRKKVHESLHKDLLRKLKHFELLDDNKFARWWTDQRRDFSKKSLKAIKQELYQKGIDRNIIEDVLADAEIDEEKTAKELIAKKSYKWDNLEAGVRKQKISQYLAGRGFGWSAIEKVVGEMVE